MTASLYSQKELLSLIDCEKFSEMQITHHHSSENAILLEISLPLTVAYSDLEEKRKKWQKESGWEIALKPFYYSADLDPTTIRTNV